MLRYKLFGRDCQSAVRLHVSETMRYDTIPLPRAGFELAGDPLCTHLAICRTRGVAHHSRMAELCLQHTGNVMSSSLRLPGRNASASQPAAEASRGINAPSPAPKAIPATDWEMNNIDPPSYYCQPVWVCKESLEQHAERRWIRWCGWHKNIIWCPEVEVPPDTEAINKGLAHQKYIRRIEEALEWSKPTTEEEIEVRGYRYPYWPAFTSTPVPTAANSSDSPQNASLPVSSCA